MNTAGIIKKTEELLLEGRGIIKLKPSDHLATGGEGSVYKPSPDTIIKLYSDPQKMIADGMAAKINQLKQIRHPFIVAPQGLVFKNQVPVGYYMAFESGEALARVFTTAYRTREQFTGKDDLSLVDGMRTVITTAHGHHAILVDANELNWLVSRKNKHAEPRVIDVDSWSLGHWKPTVIMPSIRDWHTQGFNEQSDWFSFAVVSFQVFTGIHPYKGVLNGYKPNEMERRMKDNASVFTPGVRLNSAVRDFGTIPAPLLAWYESVFQQGVRTTPPSPYDISNKTPRAAMVQRTVVTATSGRLVMDVLYNGVLDKPIKVFTCGVVQLQSGTLINLANGKKFAQVFPLHTEVIQTDEGFLVASIATDGVLSFSLVGNDGGCTLVESVIRGTEIVRYYNRMFVVTHQGLTEVSVKQFAKPLLVTKNTWQVLGNSTVWFDGIGVQDAMGTTYLVAPFSETSCQYVHVPELDSNRVVAATAGVRSAVLVVLERKTGQYKKYEMVFNKDYTNYQITVDDISSPDVNMTPLPKGVTAEIVNDGSLIISVPTTGVRNEVLDAKIDTSFILHHWDNRVVGIHDGKVWAISLRP